MRRVSVAWKSLVESHDLHRAAGRFLVVFLCGLFILVRPLDRLGGTYPFLILTFKELVFSVQDGLSQQIEITFLNYLGALFGIGVSNLAVYFTVLANRNIGVDSAISRTIPALFLTLIIFTAGFVRSRLPRMHLSARIACFISIWILTSTLNMVHMTHIYATEFLWITAIPALASLISTAIFLRATSSSYVRHVNEALGLATTILQHHVTQHFLPLEYHLREKELAKLQSSLFNKSDQLSTAYSKAVFEFRVSRFDVKRVKPFIGIVEHIRRDLSWGQSVILAEPVACACSGFHDLDMRESGEKLSQVVADSVKMIQIALNHAYGSKGRHRTRLQANEIGAQKALLSATVDETRQILVAQSDRFITHCGTTTGPSFDVADVEKSRKSDDLALFMISLLNIAEEVEQGLDICEDLVENHDGQSRRLWIPRLTVAWLGVAPRTFLFEGEHLTEDITDEPQEAHDSDLSWWEAHQGIAEKKGSLETSKDKLAHPWIYIRHLWSLPNVMNARILVSRFIRGIRHSKHLRHAFKNALGAMLLAFPVFLSKHSTGRHWFVSAHGQWMVISYVWVLEPTTGATWRVGFLRLAGTLCGALYAYVAGVVVQRNPYGLMAVLMIAEFPISWVILRTTIPPLGIVASVTLPPIILLPYTQVVHITHLQLAALRALTIAIGIILALLINHIIFPRHARVIFLTQSCRIFSQFGELYLGLCRLTMSQYQTVQERRKLLKQELQIRGSLLSRSSALVTSMEDELSLMPKPIRLYRQVVTSQQRLLDLLAGLRRIRERLPRKAAVCKVLEERRNFISAVCLSLLACENAFRSRHRLPQYLPSLRMALTTLILSVEKSIKEEYESGPEGLGFALIFAYAEHEALMEMVDEIERLLDLCRKLFGTSSWLDQTTCSQYHIRRASEPSEMSWAHLPSKA